MKILKKRPIAALVCVAVIILSTAYSAHRSLSAKVQELTDSFYTGVYDEEWGSARRSVSSQLDKRCEVTSGLLTLGDKYADSLDAPDSVNTAKDVRVRLMHSNDISEKYALNKELDALFNGLCAELEGLELSDRETAMIDEYKTAFKGAQTIIDSSGYNETVRAFTRTTLSAFPANILKGITFVQDPVLFE